MATSAVQGVLASVMRATGSVLSSGRVIAVAIALVLVFVVGGIVVTNSPLFVVTNVVVNGSDHISQDAAEQLIDVPDGATLFNVDADAIEASLKKNPWVQGVQIERQFPHTLVITPVEYQVSAIAYITTSDVAWAIDGDGVWIAPVSLSVTVDAEGNVVSNAGTTQADSQQDGSQDADADSSSDDGASADGAATADGNATDDSATGADDAATDGSSDGASDGSDTATGDGTTSEGSADGTQLLTGVDAALALASENGAMLFTNIAADVEPEEGATVASEVVLAGLQYVAGFSDDFKAQVQSLSLESVDAISAYLTSGIEVALGEPENIALKERVVTGLLEQVSGITYIDVRTPSSPTYRSAPSA